jgi:acyl-CoA synthetase (AMP-forming)/AMP-acid ligase II
MSAADPASVVGSLGPPTSDLRPPPVNVGLRLAATANVNPEGVAIAMPQGRGSHGKRIYESLTFKQLDDDSNLLADGLLSLGATPGMRLVLMVPPSIDFISLVFAMFKAGVVTVLIDPGMGRRNLIRCLAESEPEGFVGVSLAHAVRVALRRRLPKAKLNVTVGRRWFWGGATIAQLRARRISDRYQFADTKADDPAAIIFTTGSTGPPKGVLYRHGNFDRQVDEIRDFYGIQPGEIDLPGFQLFALFNCAMGVTTVIPDMDPTRPARVDPRNIVEAVNDWHVTQAFGSPALWNVVGRYCEERKITLPTLKRVLSAGAPVPPHVLWRMKSAIAPDGDVHTPYGATEALPVASISASEIWDEVMQAMLPADHPEKRSFYRWGTCVGRHFPRIDWKVIQISDEPIPRIDNAIEVPSGEVGELIVRGPVVTAEYVTRVEANALHKIQDGDSLWHRLGDVGYLDKNDHFWFCGRKAHRVITSQGTLFTIPCEAVFNRHPWVYRSALVGVGPRGNQRPVVFVEPWPEHYAAARKDFARLRGDLAGLAQAHAHTQSIGDFLLMKSLPVDIRHNAKIFREKLAVVAERKLGK